MLSLDSPGHHDVLYRLNCVVIALAAVSGLSVCSFAKSTVAIGSIPAALSGPSGALVVCAGQPDRFSASARVRRDSTVQAESLPETTWSAWRPKAFTAASFP